MAPEVLGELFQPDRLFQVGVVSVLGLVSGATLTPWPTPFDPLTGDPRHARLPQPGDPCLLGDTQR
jgi:hypothetical protein